MNTETLKDEEVVVVEEEVVEEIEEVVEEPELGEDGEPIEKTTEKPTKEEPLQVDYKAKFEALQTRVAGDAFKGRKEKRNDPEEDGEPDKDKPLTQADLAKIIEDNNAKTARTLNEGKASTFAESLTSNEDEAAYAVELWKHVTLPFDSMEEQMNFIVAGMNSERLFAQNGELRRSLKSKDSSKKNTANTEQKPKTNAPSMSGDMTAALKSSGFKYDSGKKAYVKTLANGKKLYQDKSGKKWVE